MVDIKQKIQAVIFDLDDTLISEYEFVKSGYHFVSDILPEKLGRPAAEIEARLWELSSKTYSRAFNRLFDSFGVSYTEEELKELITAYRNHPADTRFYSDVPETLEALKERKILIGIISDGDPERQKNKIRSAVAGMSDKAVDHWFDEIILNDEFGGAEFRKPNPKGFEEMAGRLGIDPAQMIYTGDNPSKDFHIAADLPVRTARIIRENGIYSSREYLDGIRETWRIGTLTELLPIVDGEGA